jgi:hypothetical protein
MATRLDFEIDSELEMGLITGHAGVPGLIEAFRQTGTAAVIDRGIQLKSRKRGLSAAAMVESLLSLWAAGGERAEDLDQFRQTRRWRYCSGMICRRRSKLQHSVPPAHGAGHWPWRDAIGQDREMGR